MEKTIRSLLLLASFWLPQACAFGQHQSICEQQTEAERVGLGFEELFDGFLSVQEWSCLHSFQVHYVTLPQLENFCDAQHTRLKEVAGCLNMKTKQIYIARILLPQEEVYVLRHELAHLLLQCIGFDDVANQTHNSPLFNYSGYANNSYSLAVLADQVEAPNLCLP